MKRILSVVFAFLLLFTAVIPVNAAEMDSVISPRFSYIEKLQTSLSISSLGIATCTASAYKVGGSSLKIICRLQQYKDGAWSTIKTWTATGTNMANISKTYAVYSGYTYRTYTSCYVYNEAGTRVETGACYSSQVTY